MLVLPHYGVPEMARSHVANKAERLNAAETCAPQKALLCEAVLLAKDTPPPPKKHWTPVVVVFKPFLLRRLQAGGMQSKIFAASCLTPGFPVPTLMIMSFVSCVEWHSMGKREASVCLCIAIQAISLLLRWAL